MLGCFLDDSAQTSQHSEPPMSDSAQSPEKPSSDLCLRHNGRKEETQEAAWSGVSWLPGLSQAVV